jgi:outer membrane protein assembly complex protein YaeT
VQRIRIQGGRRLLLIGILLLGTGGVEGPGVARSQTAIPSIESIDFEGNASISDGRLRRAMRLRQPAWWNPFRKTPYLGSDYLTQDLYRVLDVYRDRGFPFATVLDAAVSVLGEGEKVEIEITLDEGPACTVGEIRFEGIDPVRLEPVRERCTLSPGDPLSRAGIARARNAIEAYYAEAGFLTTQVKTDIEIHGTAGVVWIRVREGQVYTLRSVVIDTAASRLERTKPKVVTREVALRPSDIVRSSRLQKTQDQLFETGVLRTVRVVPMPDTTGAPVADLRITVHERSAGWYGFGAGFTSDDRFRLLAEWGNRNLGGMARRIEANGDIAFPLDRSLGDGFPVKSALIRLGYTEGWFLGTRTRSQSSLSHTYERLTSTSDLGETVFDQDITSFEEVLSRSVGRHSVVGLGITNKFVRSGDPSATDDTYITRNVSATFERDRRNDLLDPSQGTLFRSVAEYAGGLLGGTAEFSRWTLIGSWHLPLGRGVTLSSRARTGLIVPVGKGLARGDDPSRVSRIPIEERFRLGGGTSVRGYAENSVGRVDTSGVAVGGTAVLLTNLELRFPLVWLIKGAVFADAGNVWADPDEIRLSRFTDGLDRSRRSPLNVAYGLGGGLRFVTPVGPFRVDYGWKLGGGQREKLPPGELHLSLGQAF